MKSYSSKKIGVFKRFLRDYIAPVVLSSVLGCGGGDDSTPVVPPVNNAPVAQNDSVNVDEDSIDNSISVLANDSDAEDGVPTLQSIVSGPSNGSAVVDGNQIDYTPNPNFYGNDNFTYRVIDSGGKNDSANVSVTVTNINDAPVIDPLPDLIVEAGGLVDINPFINVNDVDGDIPNLSFSFPLDASGQWLPADDDIGNYTGITVTADDGNGGFNSDSFDLLVTSPNSSLDISDNLEYIIITSSGLAPNFQSLVDWKRSKGVMTEIFSEDEDINPGGVPYASSRDRQEGIREVIKYQKSLHPELEYVLLGGDVEVVPVRKVYHAGEDINVACDLYYSDLDSTWDEDEDSVFGEEDDNLDLYPNVFVGRAPVNISSEVDNFVWKVLNYEQNPELLGINEYLFLAGEIDASTDTGVNANKIDVDHIPGYVTITKLYESLGNLDSINALIALNNGPHIVNIDGHGEYFAIGTGLDNLLREDVDETKLTNSPKNPIIYNASCWTNASDNEYTVGDCIGEILINNTSGGAVGYIGKNRESFAISGSPEWGTAARLNRSFFEELFNNSVINIGKTLGNSIIQFIPFSQGGTSLFRHELFATNGLFDPEMPIWTNHLVGDNISAVVSGTDYTLVDTNAGVGAKVCLTKQDGSVYSALTNSSGDTIFNVTYDALNNKITVTKENWKPYKSP